MDGNGRWAKSHGLIRTKGHQVGADKIDMVAKFCIKEDIKILTLYVFSTENWKRPQNEIKFLLKLFKEFLVSKKENFVKNEIKFNTIGDLSKFDEEINEKILELQKITNDFSRLTLNLAINYGGRDEIIRACKKISSKNLQINEENLNENLDLKDDVDLLIRTGGLKRLSNFLLWQNSYAEFAFSDALWPDFSEQELKKITDEYKKIDRKFGGL